MWLAGATATYPKHFDRDNSAEAAEIYEPRYNGDRERITQKTPKRLARGNIAMRIPVNLTKKIENPLSGPTRIPEAVYDELDIQPKISDRV